MTILTKWTVADTTARDALEVHYNEVGFHVSVQDAGTRFVAKKEGTGSGVWDSIDPMTDLVDDTTPQLGAALDCNGKSITSASNADVTIAPNGTGVVVLSATELSSGTNEDVILNPNGTGVIQAGANVDLKTFSLVTTTTNGNVIVAPNGTGIVQIGSTGIGTVSNGDLDFVPHGTGGVLVSGSPIGGKAAVALTDQANIATDAALGNVFTCTLGGNRTLDNPTNLVVGLTYMWVFTQDGTGSRTLAYGAMFLFETNTHTLTTAAASVDTIIGTYDGTSLHCRLEKAMA